MGSEKVGEYQFDLASRTLRFGSTRPDSGEYQVKIGSPSGLTVATVRPCARSASSSVRLHYAVRCVIHYVIHYVIQCVIRGPAAVLRGLFAGTRRFRELADQDEGRSGLENSKI